MKLKERVMEYVNTSLTNEWKEKMDFLERFEEQKTERKEIKLPIDKIAIFHLRRDIEENSEECYTELDGETLTVFECNIRPGDVISFIRYHKGYDKNYSFVQSYYVDIKFDEQNAASEKICGVYDQESVQSLRLKIQHQLSIPYEKQILTIGCEKNPSLSRKVDKKELSFIFLQVIQRKQDVCGAKP